MVRKLGYHVNIFTDAAVGTVRTQRDGSIIKFLTSGVNRDLMSEWKGNNPNGIAVVRHHVPSESRMPVADRVQQMFEHVDDCRDVIDVLETPYNEEFQTVTQGIYHYAVDTVQAVDMIKQRWPEIKVAVGHFSVGNPPEIEGDWSQFAPALEVADYLSLHEYGSPFVHSEQDDPHGERRMQIDTHYPGGWWMLRYRQVYQFLRARGFPTPPLILSEIGRDHGLHTRPPKGWRQNIGFGSNDADVYAGELRWFARELARDLYVKGATIFACGAPPDWATFDVAGSGQIENVVNEDINAPIYTGSILAHTPRPSSATGGTVNVPPPVESAPPPAPARAPSTAEVNVYRNWKLTPGNMNPLTGPEGLQAFTAHLSALGVDPARAYELGFPAFKPVMEAPPRSSTEPIPGPTLSRSSEQMATLLRVDADLLQAIINIESGGSAFARDGQLIARFEVHVFARECDKVGFGARARATFNGTDSWKPAGHTFTG